MSQLDELSLAIKNLSNDTKRESLEETSTFREEASKNQNEMYDISKDLAKYFENQKEKEDNVAEEIKENIIETENIGRKVEDSNAFLQNSIHIQEQMLAEIGNVNASIEKLITDFPIWLREANLNSTGAGGLSGLASLLEAGGIAGLLFGKKGKTGKAITAAEESATAAEGITGTGEIAAAGAASKSSVLGRLGEIGKKIGIGKVAGSAANFVENSTILSKTGSLLGKGLRALPFIGDIYQGIERGYESGSFGEGLAASVGSLGGRITGGFVGSAAGPVGTFAGEVGGSILGANALADQYHKKFNNQSNDTNSTSKPSGDNSSSTPTAPQQTKSSPTYTENGTGYTNVPHNIRAIGGKEIEPWSPKSQEIITGTGLIPNVGVRSPSTTLGGSISPGNPDNYLHGFEHNNVGGGELSPGGGSRYSGKEEEYHGGSGGKTVAKGSLAKNQQLAYNEAKKQGLSDSAARILVANMSGESLANPSNNHWDRTHMSQGIVQWDPQRAARIQKEFGKLPMNMTVEEQTKAAIWEMKTFPKEFKGAYDTLTNEKLSEAQRMYGLVHGYEKPADSQGQTSVRLGMLHGLRVKEEGKDSSGENISDNIKGLPAGTPPEITSKLKQMKARGLVTNDQCVSLANASVGSRVNVHDWRKGESADSGELVAGTPIATFLNRRGQQTNRYAGGGSGTPGAHLDHAAVFENYIKDKEGHNIGMHVAEQYKGSHGIREKNYMFGKGFGEANASNYNAIKTTDGGYLGGQRNPMSRHLEATQKPTERITRSAPPAPQEHKQERMQVASKESHGDTTGSGGHYGTDRGIRSDSRVRSVSVSPDWGDIVKSVTGSYGIA